MGKLKLPGLLLFVVFLALFPAACSNSTMITSVVTAPVFTGPPDKVEVLYFHSPTRCGTCLCFEESITNVINTDFAADISSGKVTYNVCDIGDSANAALVKKYQAVSSALYLNSIKDGLDHIVNVQDIWSWNCTTDVPGFEANIKDTISKTLAGLP